jgi:hypothetical protein
LSLAILVVGAQRASYLRRHLGGQVLRAYSAREYLAPSALSGMTRAAGPLTCLVDGADLGAGDLPVTVGAVEPNGDRVAAGAVRDLGPVRALGPG